MSHLFLLLLDAQSFNRQVQKTDSFFLPFSLSLSLSSRRYTLSYYYALSTMPATERNRQGLTLMPSGETDSK